MKKKQLKEIIAKLDDFICMNERHMQIQDNALIRKDEEILVAMTSVNEFKLQLQETQEALSRSRNFVRIIQSDKRRSIKDMAKDLFDMYFMWGKSWDTLSEEDQEHWMGKILEIISGEKLGKGLTL